MPGNKTNMPYEREDISVRDRVADLNSMFRNLSRLEMRIEDEKAEKELEILRRLEKYKLQIFEKQKKLEEKWLKERDQKERTLSKEAFENEEKLHQEKMANIAEEYKARLEAFDKLEEQFKKIDKKYKGTVGSLFGSFAKTTAFSNAGFDNLAVGQLVKGLSSFLKQFDNKIEEIASYQNRINTRLYGSSRRWDGLNGIANTITAVTGASPYVRTADVMKNVDAMVQQGIAFNIEQRAFLNTVKDSIASTFNAANGTLLQLIRIQQADSTAARLGMEAALNQYLNNMFQTTEYLTDAADSVKSSIYEASALMTAQAGVAFEYQVQKWLGSLYSVGMSRQSVDSIASALGQLGSGDVTSLAGTGMQNLLVMAAGRAGLSYSEILTKGLDDSGTNKLLQAMVDYLATIANDNRVVQSAYAKVFGLSSSDIIAASTLATDTSNIAKSSLDYSGGLNKLRSMMNTMAFRVSTGGMLSNIWDNMQYTMAEGIASNPALYAVYKAAGLLDEVAGGIPIPAISVMGNMVDLETSVADMMRAGTLGSSLLGSMGKMFTSLGTNILPSSMLYLLGINDTLSTTGRGRAATFESGVTLSSTVYRGQQSSSDVYESLMNEAEDQKQEVMKRVNPEEDTSDIKLKDLNATVLNIYNLLSNVISGDTIKVSNTTSAMSPSGITI